jgi:hypothetical protein
LVVPDKTFSEVGGVLLHSRCCRDARLPLITWHNTWHRKEGFERSALSPHQALLRLVLKEVQFSKQETATSTCDEASSKQNQNRTLLMLIISAEETTLLSPHLLYIGQKENQHS